MMLPSIHLALCCSANYLCRDARPGPGLALIRYTRGYTGLATCHIRQVICRILPYSASKVLGHYMLQIVLAVDLPFEADGR